MNCNSLNASITSTVNHAIGSDDMSDDSSPPDSPMFDDADLLASPGVNDDITSQLMAAGPVGVAAAAAIATGKKRRKRHLFEINPSTRKRQQTRLLRKIKMTIDEYTTRIGQQALLLIVTPGKPQNNFKVFGAHPLESVVRNCRNIIMQELEAELANQAPTQTNEDSTLHELPHLIIDGIPTPVEKMTQAQLRAFIPLMLKYSTGRGKPGWGKEGTKPPWWPSDLPWANVRSDVRSEEDKQRVSWTHALRQIVINCYKHHGREDLLPTFNEAEEKEKTAGLVTQVISSNTSNNANTVALTTANGTENAITVSGQEALYTTQPITAAHFTPAMVQTINNPDGTLSIIHVDPNTLVTLPDGLQGEGTPMRMLSLQYVNEEYEDDKKGIKIENSHGDISQAVHAALGEAAISHQQDGSEGGRQPATINMSLNGGAMAHTVTTLAEATLSHDGQIILTGEDGTQSTFPVSGMVTIPVSMYQTVVDVSNLSNAAVQAASGGLQVLEPVITEVRSHHDVGIVTPTAAVQSTTTGNSLEVMSSSSSGATANKCS